MKFIVTGGAGFIGSAFCRFLINQTRCRVVNLDSLTYAASLGSLKLIEQDARYSFIKVDIRDAESLNKIFFSEHQDAVVHFAAETHVDRSITNHEDFISTNILGTYNLLEAYQKYVSDLNIEKR